MKLPEHITLTLILGRCRECAICGAQTHYVGGSEDRAPTIEVTFDGKRRKLFVRRVVWQLQHPTGRLPSGQTSVITSSCTNRRCVSPPLLYRASKSAAWAKAAAHGIRVNAASTARMVATRRARSKLPEHGVEDIRTSAEHPKVLAQKWGVSEAYVYMLKRGDFRKPAGNPLAGLLR